jgi:hypothetical protein
MPSFKYKPFMQSVVMLNVVMLNVVMLSVVRPHGMIATNVRVENSAQDSSY